MIDKTKISKASMFSALVCVMAAFCVCVPAQKILKPTLDSVAPTQSQQALIDAGIALHDKKKFDEAIAEYQKVLDENPNCTIAMYEMALSYVLKGDNVKALEIATKGTRYKSPELPFLYLLVGNTLDDLGKPQEAISVFRDAIRFLKEEKVNDRVLSNPYYNLGVTYARQKMYNEAREVLKNAVVSNSRYSSPNYVLSEVFYSTKYKVPALLAAGRFISLETNTPRSRRSAQIFLEIMKPAKKDESGGKVTVVLDSNSPNDEGDFRMYDLVLGTLLTVKTDEDKNKTEEEMFADAFDTLIGILAEDKNLRGTWVGKSYLPFFVEARKTGNSRILAYRIMQQNGNANALKWLLDNQAKAFKFNEWAKNY